MKTAQKPDRTRIRTRSRRLTACHRHPDELVTGICAACLRERLSGIDDDSATDESSSTFRRCRSVSGAKSEVSCSYNEPRRKSCDVLARNSLADPLFDEMCRPIGSGAVAIESKNLGFDNDDEDVGEVMTMKEHIDLVIVGSKKHQKKTKDITSLWEAASVFSKKLQNWKLKPKNKRPFHGNLSRGIDDCEPKMEKPGQREPTRLSVDGGRRISVDGSQRISVDEPRASWDGYLIARTIPRLAPMLSVVENGMLGDGNKLDGHRLSVDGHMHSIIEDESSSSGGSGQSNLDSSSSQRWSSFDRSVSVASSSKKTVGLESDEATSSSSAKLVITERELKDWRLKSSSVKDDNCSKFEQIGKGATFEERGGNFNGSKKSTRLRKMFSVLNVIPKSSEKKFGNLTGNAGAEARENGRAVKETSKYAHARTDDVANRRKSLDMFGFNKTTRNDKEVKEASAWKHTFSDSVDYPRNSFDVGLLSQRMRNGEEMKEDCPKFSRCGSVASSRRSCDMIRLNHDTRSVAKDAVSSNQGGEDFVLELSKSAKKSFCKIGDDDLPFYLTPLRSSRRNKSGRRRPQESAFS